MGENITNTNKKIGIARNKTKGHNFEEKVKVRFKWKTVLTIMNFTDDSEIQKGERNNRRSSKIFD